MIVLLQEWREFIGKWIFFCNDTNNITRLAGTILRPGTKFFMCLKRRIFASGNMYISQLWRHHWWAGVMVYIELLKKLVSFRIMYNVFKFGVCHWISWISILMASVLIPRSLWCSKWNLFANTYMYSKMFSNPPLAIPLPCQIFIGQKVNLK